MSTDTPGQRAEATPEWAPLPPAAPKPPRRPSPRALAIAAGAVTLAVILIATTIFALRGASRPTTANRTASTAPTAPTATTVPTATTAPTATLEPGAAPAAPLSVYFAAGTSGSGTLFAVNPADGTVRWKVASLNGSAFTPALGGNRVFVLVVNGPLIAFQSLDGKELWRVTAPHAGAVPVLDGDILYTAANGDSAHSGSVVAYSAASGSVLWQKDLGLNANVNMGASGGTLYLSLGRSFEALRGSDGAMLWQQSSNTPLAVPPIVVDGTLYFNYYGEVFAFNAADGSPRWHYRPQQLFSQGATTLAVGGGFIFAGSGTSVIALHEADGTLAWSKECRNIPFGTAVSGGVVYAACSAGGLDAFQATTGQPIWSVQLNGDHAWPALVSGNTVFVGVNPGATPNGAPAYVYALRPGDGSVMWQFTATSAGGVSAPVVA